MAIVSIKINDKVISSESGSNLLEVAKINDIHIPHFCYDKRMEAYGGCGLCVVEVEGNPKLVRSCSTKITEGMVVNTNTEKVQQTRSVALKLLSSDHRGDCRPPCVMACPAETDIQGYVGLIANGQYSDAIKVIKEKIPMPASIGRVCPHPCETACRRTSVEEAVSIANLKTFAADIDLFETETPFMPEVQNSTGKRIGIVGAGPSGLTAAYYLLMQGHDVELFDMMDKPGGMLRYGIPEYRLSNNIIDKEIESIEKMGATFNYNKKLGSDYTLEDLDHNFDASYIAIGAWKSSGMRCTGEELNGVLGGIDFLRDVVNKKELELGQKIIVVGGGNTAMDVARTCIRLGKDVRVLYRRTEDQMPAEKIEILEAKEEGVLFDFLVAPTVVNGNNKSVESITCQKMMLGEEDASGRRRPVPVEGDMMTFEADSVIAAIGQRVDASDLLGLELTDYGTIKVNPETFETNLKGIFAGGDAVTGPKIAIDAVAHGKKAADVIDSFLKGKIMPVQTTKIITKDDFDISENGDVESFERAERNHISPDIRKNDFNEFVANFSEEVAINEGLRCLECGCNEYYDCKLVSEIQLCDIDVSTTFGVKHNRYEASTHELIDRNPDKCIACGLCVRTCDDHVGINALGVIDRGFNTIIAPSFNLSLEESDCVSCGQCTDVCPTGALKVKLKTLKEIPLKLEETEGTCTHCNVGCKVVFRHKSDLIYKVSPDYYKGYGIICKDGKFGYEGKQLSDVLITPTNINAQADIFTQIENADLIIVLGELYQNYTPVASRIKEVQTKTIIVNHGEDLLSNRVECVLYQDDYDIDMLKKAYNYAKNPIVIVSDESLDSSFAKHDDNLFVLKKSYNQSDVLIENIYRETSV